MQVFENNLPLQQKIIQVLLNLAKVDNIFHPNEMLYIQKISTDFGWSNEEFQGFIKEEMDVNDVKFPKSEQERMSILYYLLFMSKFDKEVSDSEVNFLYKLALQLGVRRDLTDDLIEIMKNHIGQIVPVNLMLETIKKYLN